MPVFKSIFVCIVTLCFVKLKMASSYPWLEQISRQELLSSVCDNLKLRTSNRIEYNELSHVLADHKHKLLYCYVPKVACTNWKRVLMVLTELSNVTNLVNIPASTAHADTLNLSLAYLNPNDTAYSLNNYVTFLMVRHPFERLLSAYRNKFEDTSPSAKYFQTRYGRYIIRNYRPKASLTDLKTGSNVSFREFAQFIINEGSEGNNSNEHWKPIYRLCHPCSLNYTFVGKYEKFDEDAQVLLNMISAPFIEFPRTRSSGTSDVLKFYYQQLSLNEIERLYRLYQYDFMLFGYSLEDILGFDIG